MLDFQALLNTADVRVSDVSCSHPPVAWAQTEVATRSAVVFARRGVFRRRGRHGEDVIEPGVAYLQRAGEEDEFAHPHGGDSCTAIGVSDALLASLLDEPRLPAGVVHTLPREDLALRKLASEDDAVALLSSIFARLVPARLAGRPATAAARRSLASDAREVLAADPSVGVVGLGRAVGASPHHLSRVFRDEVGVPISTYRRRLRLRRALERLGDGDLARVAADAGYSDHAHFAREARALLGASPSALRRDIVLKAAPRPGVAHADRQGVDASARRVTNVSSRGMLD